MPRAGALVLSDARKPGAHRRLRVRAAGAGPNTYNVARLMERHGDAKLTDLLQTLANCPKVRAASIHEHQLPTPASRRSRWDFQAPALLTKQSFQQGS